MTPELEKQVVSLIEAAKQAGSDAASCIADQAPEVIEQMLAWEMAKSVAGLLVCLSLAILFLWCGRKLKKLGDDDYPPPAMPYGVAVVCTVLFVVCAMNIIKIKIAPKVVILEIAEKVVRGK